MSNKMEQTALFDQLGLTAQEKTKFEPLLRYFTNLDIDDFKTFNRYQMEEVVERNDYLLMLRFVDRVKEWLHTP